jgi:hypothetical protein
MLKRGLIVLAVLTAAGAGVAYAATLNVASAHLWTGSQTLTKATCTVTSATDTYVDENKPTSNFGSTNTMLVKPDSGTRQWTFIRFDLSSCALPTTGGADSATLKLFVQTAPKQNRTLTVAPALTTWAGTLTWNQAQSLTYGGPTTTFTTGTTNNVLVSIPVTVDVDDLVKSTTANSGWRISDGGAAVAGDATTFTSTNAASNKPQLVINYEK